MDNVSHCYYTHDRCSVVIFYGWYIGVKLLISVPYYGYIRRLTSQLALHNKASSTWRLLNFWEVSTPESGLGPQITNTSFQIYLLVPVGLI